MKILGVITARGGSKGIPKKNIKELGGYPLIAYTISVAKKSRLISDLILSTENEEIAKISRKYGVKIPFMRPVELASDTAKHVPVLQHAVFEMEKIKGIKYDFIVLLQPTSPFRLVEDIDKTVEVLIKKRADSAVSLNIVEDNHPIKAKIFRNGFVYPYFNQYPELEGARRQDLPVCYKRSGAVYAMRRDLLIKKGLIYGKKIAGYVVPNERSIDIDSEKDWVVAEYMLSKLLKKGYKFIDNQK